METSNRSSDTIGNEVIKALYYIGQQFGGGGGTGTVTSINVAGGVNLTATGGPVTTSGTITVDHDASGVSAGTYGDGTHVPVVTLDAQGHVTAVTSTAITTPGSGTVTSVGVSSTDLTVSGSPITTSGSITLDLGTSGVSAGTYGSSTAIPVVTVDAKGRITSASTTSISTTFSTLTVSGTSTFSAGQVVAVRVVTASGAVVTSAADYAVVVNKTVGAATTVNLHATPTTGCFLIIKDGKGDASANAITITPAAGTIDGAASFIVSVNYGSATLVYNGTEWNVL